MAMQQSDLNFSQCFQFHFLPLDSSIYGLFNATRNSLKRAPLWQVGNVKGGTTGWGNVRSLQPISCSLCSSTLPPYTACGLAMMLISTSTVCEQAEHELLSLWISTQSRRDVTPSCKIHRAISMQGLIGSIFVECTTTMQWYLQQLQNEVIPVIQGAQHVDNIFPAARCTPTYSECGLRRSAWHVWQPCPVESIPTALRLWEVLTTMFTGHESLWLFPLRLDQRSCVPHQPAHCS
jgi:hypothetical protein